MVPPIPGGIQRNREEPTIWVMISVILLTNIRDDGCGLDVISFLSQLALVIAGFTFVDDTDIINTERLVNTTGEELLKKPH